VIVSLWFRLISLGIVALVFAEALILAPGKAQGWSFYLTTQEVIFEVAVRLIFAGLAGIALGTLCTLLLSPFLLFFSSSRERLADWAIKVAVVLVVFLDSRLALVVLIKWFHRGLRFEPALLVLYFVAFVVALCIPRSRREVVTSLDSFASEKMSRRTALATVVGAAALVATESVLGKAAPVVKAALGPQRPKSNFLLITFDALDAEDMSVYGRKLPTTPNIDAFASKSTVFTNFYSASTFTTPSVATMLTGVYPSQSQVYHLQGRIRRQDAEQTLPHAMRAGGYTTAAFLSNPFAYYLAEGIENEYDFLPQPAFHEGGIERLWNATSALHQDSGFGNRIDEYFDFESIWNTVGRLPRNIAMRYRPEASFEHARRMLDQLPDGFFLWVHVITPHNPYLPGPEDRGRFLPPDKVTTYEEETGERWKPHYTPDQQPLVDERRLRYDEFIATADRAFGKFMSDFEKSGKAQNTTVMFSADHGEGFEGGVYQHSSPYLTRPVIHVPLIIRTPGQQESRKVAFVADQTALAPTILELAGQPAPASMRGQSLVKWLNRNANAKVDAKADANAKAEAGDQAQGLAFTQYLEKNSAFRPLHHGTVGVIDGQYQYVLDLDTEKGELRPLDQAQIWNLDRTSENPARAESLRAAIYSRFPELHKSK
jgi:arylsulfatase A-like enzyme